MRGGTARRIAAAIGVAATLTTALPARAEAPQTFSDVPAEHWARTAIEYVTDPAHELLPARQEGFGPGDPLTRRDLARALVRAFPPPSEPVSDRVFEDVAADDPLLDAFRWAAKRHFLPVRDGSIKPDAGVTRRVFDPAVVRALGYADEAKGIATLQTKGGERVVSGWSTGFVMVAQRLELYPNLRDEASELRPSQPLTRAHAAMALARVHRLIDADEWSIGWRLEGYAEPPLLPTMSPLRLRAVRWAMQHVAFPYIWGGEWNRATGSGYPYGAQPQGGFDCSGFAWWMLQESTANWNVAALRGFDGWQLTGRTATDMARNAPKKIAFAKTMPMDLAFFELNGDPSRFEHMGVLLGNGWMIHSSGSRGGVSLERVDAGYWRERFAFARRVIPIDA